ncbi:Hypothetical protein NTJ_12455 [Nesidiocoris tenuis]|uniref:Uncharacterized protein n=1 Tax=Nesidiocoris tenuis TaxID=355587 RepID=A0ABN7B5V4_9HEMI|nr:Hypothetical protein NTJ_12455 [Nesidiocoris tenuis]
MANLFHQRPSLIIGEQMPARFDFSVTDDLLDQFQNSLPGVQVKVQGGTLFTSVKSHPFGCRSNSIASSRCARYFWGMQFLDVMTANVAAKPALFSSKEAILRHPV